MRPPAFSVGAGAGERRSGILVEQDDEREATCRERALNAEAALKAAHAEILTQRTRIGELLGQIRDLEAERTEEAIQRITTENSTAPACPAPRLEALREGASQDQVRSLVAEFGSLTDPRGASGVHYRLSSLLAPVVCVMTSADHDSLTVAAEWCRRAVPEELAAFGPPYHPLLGRYRVPSEKTLGSVLGRLDPAELSAAGFAHVKSLLPAAPATPVPLTPDGGPEREQRRAHRAAAQADPLRRLRQAIAVDGKSLRGARRPDGSRDFVLSAVRHGAGITLASREIGAKTNEIPEFQPLLDQVDDVDLAGAVVTADALLAVNCGSQVQSAARAASVAAAAVRHAVGAIGC